MARPIIEVEKLSKLYHLGLIGGTTFRDSVEHWWHRMRGEEEKCYKIGKKKLMISADDPQAGREPNTMWALKDISFSVQQGEIIGIIGKNGAGKSTLLKILARITEPSSGEAVLRGRVASLLEVGTGFHPELTGRENIYLNGAMLGMRKLEIDRKFDEIVAFAEIEKFIDTPVKRYSSGMYVRLAFAVAAHLEPEILLVDEVLAVGDVSFQKKCLGKMGEVAKQGRTVLFVSHNMGMITQLCKKGIYMDAGKIAYSGDIDSVVSTYLTATSATASIEDLERSRGKTGEVSKVFFRKVAVANHEGLELLEGDVRQPIYLNLEYEVTTSLKNIELSLRIDDYSGRPIFTTSQSDCSPECLISRKPGVYQVTIKIPEMFLMPNKYFVSVFAHEPNVQFYAFNEHILSFSIIETGTKVAKYDTHRALGAIIIDLPWEEKMES
jgi:homopolymeric O-antigen transport system ATP-binding protein